MNIATEFRGVYDGYDVIAMPDQKINKNTTLKTFELYPHATNPKLKEGKEKLVVLNNVLELLGKNERIVPITW